MLARIAALPAPETDPAGRRDGVDGALVGRLKEARMAVHFLDTFREAEAPPPGVSPPLEALWWLRKGGFATGPAWERAHEICQSGEGTRAYDLSSSRTAH